MAERTNLTEADPLDVLVHPAWNHPLATRIDRARRVRKEDADFFEAYRPERVSEGFPLTSASIVAVSMSLRNRL